MGARRRVVLLCASTALAAVALGSAGRADAQSYDPRITAARPAAGACREAGRPMSPPEDGDTAPSEAPAPSEPPAPRNVRGNPAGIDLTTLETRDLSLLYFDPMQTYLTPYIARGFENALPLNRKLFNWKPWDRTTVLLKDFSDYGNAAARSSPNNAILLDVAPLEPVVRDVQPGRALLHADEP